MAQGRGNAFVFALAVLALLQAAAAKDYTVGDSNEWNYPPGTDSIFYTDTWASKYKFAVGDNLDFKYAMGAHDVQVVSASEYADCLMSNGKKYTSGSDTIPLTKAGDYYFLCTFLTHCAQGMKLKVTVNAAGGTPPAVAPVAPPPEATPAPVVAPVKPPPAVALPPPVKAPAPARAVKAPAPAPKKAPVPAPVGVPAPVPVVAPTPPVVVPATPAPSPTLSSSGSSLRVCLSFVAVAAIAALLV